MDARRFFGLCSIGLVGVVGLAACGGPKVEAADVSTSSTAAATASGANPALTAYSDCLKANGVDRGFAGGRGQRPSADGSAANAGTPPSTSTSTSTSTSVSTPAATPRTTIDPAVLAKAQEACKDTLPAGVTPGAGGFGPGGGGAGAGGAGRAGQSQALAAYLSCMKDNGVAVPDQPVTPPTGAPPSTIAAAASAQPGQPGGRSIGGLDRNDPSFAAANEKCQVLLPNAGQGGGPGGGQGGPGAAPTTTAPPATPTPTPTTGA